MMLKYESPEMEIIEIEAEIRTLPCHAQSGDQPANPSAFPNP